MVARTVLETLRAVVTEPEDVEAVLNVMNKLADDVGKLKNYLPLNKPTRVRFFRESEPGRKIKCSDNNVSNRGG